MNLDKLEKQARILIDQDQKIEAIKLVRRITGWGLKESKDYVDALARAALPALNPADEAALEQTGWGLRDSKDYVDSLESNKKHRRKRRRKRAKTRPASDGFQVGDSGVVRSGTKDPDFDIEIGGWQGRISEIHPTGNQDTVMIAWDSVTLRQIPDWVIAQSAERGLDWTLMGIEIRDVELTDPRDTERDVARAIKALSQEHTWSWLGEEGTRIGEILAGVAPDDELALLGRWEEHLRRHLRFPFDAEVAEYQERGPLQSGNHVSVQRIFDVDDHYGIIVLLKHRRQQVHFPLCDLEAADEHSSNYQQVLDYAVWFANR